MDNQKQARFGPTDLLMVGAMNVVWGLNFIAIKNSITLVGPLTAALLRQTIVALVCLPMLRIIPGRMKNLLTLGVLSGGLFYIVNNLAVAAAVNLSALAIVSQLGAPFSLILAIIFLKEKVRRFRIFGMALSFAGVAILVFDPAIAHEHLGIGLMVGCSMIWAVCTLIQRDLKGVKVMTIFAWIGLLGALILLPAAYLFEPQNLRTIPSITATTLGWITFSALGSTLIGQGFMSALLQRHPVSSVVPMTLAAPVIAVISSAVYFGTGLSPTMILGGLIALTGVAIITIRSARAEEGRL